MQILKILIKVLCTCECTQGSWILWVSVYLKCIKITKILLLFFHNSAVKRDGVWKKWTYKQYYESSIQAAKSFIKVCSYTLSIAENWVRQGSRTCVAEGWMSMAKH